MGLTPIPMKHFRLPVILLALIISLPVFTGSTFRKTCTFGIMADVHKDIMHDADRRLQTFITAMNKDKPDFIVELGDFCQPVVKNRGFLDIWNSYRGKRFAVLGNHDMDGGFSRDSAAAFMHSPGRFYAFNNQGFHFLVLDCNEVNPSPDHQPGYPHFIGKEQLEWLKSEIRESKSLTVIFSHQPLNSGIEDSREVLALLKEANQANPTGKVIACFNGHDHADQYLQISGIWFIQINSMSYDWLGDPYAHRSYPDSIHARFPAIQYTAPYKDPIWGLVTLTTDGKIIIRGKKTVYVGPSPADLKHPGKAGGIPFSTTITDTILLYKH